MTIWCLVPNLLFYTVASLFYLTIPLGFPLRLNEGGRLRLERAAHTLTFFGLLLHLVYLAYFYFLRNSFPFSLDPGDLLAFLSGGVVLLFLWLVLRSRWEGLGAFFVPLGLILFLISLVLHEGSGPFMERLMRQTWLISLHVAFALLSVLFMLGTLILGLAFFLQESRLKNKRWDYFSSRFPPLLLNEKRAIQWLRIGFLLLTFVLITGSILMGDLKIFNVFSFFHVLLALVAWALYAFVLNGRWMGIKGRKMILLSFLGFVSLSISFLWN